MLDKKVTELLVDQVNKEFYSSYLYLAFLFSAAAESSSPESPSVRLP